MTKKRKIKFIVQAVKWFDKVNGNTYHSVRVTRCADGAVIAAPFTYGYGDQYRQTALEAMARAKWLPVKYRDGNMRYRYTMDHNYPIEWMVSDGLKRDCVANGVL